MDQIYIVLKNGKVDEVFDNAAAAETHRYNLQKKWSIAQTIVKELRSL